MDPNQPMSITEMQRALDEAEEALKMANRLLSQVSGYLITAIVRQNSLYVSLMNESKILDDSKYGG